MPDRELVCAPFNSPEGQHYFAAMMAASNFAWANRHLIGHWVREAWQTILGKNAHLSTVYDVSHNIGKREKHIVNGVTKELLLHRKGATRSFGPSRPEVPAAYKSVGQPVLIPGTMGTSSYVLVGTDASLEQAFGSFMPWRGKNNVTCESKKINSWHHVARKNWKRKGLWCVVIPMQDLAEEAPIAYKDVDAVVNMVAHTGLARKVARVVPLAVIKGG